MTEPAGIEVEVLAKQLREAISFGQAQAEKRVWGTDWWISSRLGFVHGGSTETLKTEN